MFINNVLLISLRLVVRQHLGLDLELVEGKPAGGHHTAEDHRIRDAVHLQVRVAHRVVECHLSGNGIRFHFAGVGGARFVQAAHLDGAPSVRVAGAPALPQLKENLQIFTYLIIRWIINFLN